MNLNNRPLFIQTRSATKDTDVLGTTIYEHGYRVIKVTDEGAFPFPSEPAIATTCTNTIGMEFVRIAAGKFEMGSPSDEEGRWSNEGPVHHVNIENAFYVGRYEVTQKQWREIMGDNPSWFKGDDLPVESVSWDDVQEFIMNRILAIMPGIGIIPAIRRIRSVRRSPIHGVCMTCTVILICTRRVLS